MLGLSRCGCYQTSSSCRPAMSLPPDLRVLVRRLASTSPDDLPRICPTLINHVIRCAGPLSAPHELKPKEGSSETSVLVHKFKTHISSLLNGRSPGGRFAAVILVKAVIDVGGWECLRLSEPWVRGLISVLRVRLTQISAMAVTVKKKKN